MSKKASLKDAFVRSGSAESAAPPPPPAVVAGYESGVQAAEAVSTAYQSPVQPAIQPSVSTVSHTPVSTPIPPPGSLYTQPPVPLYRQQTASPLAPTPIQKKKATFNLNAALHQRLKIAAAIHRREMVDIVEDALQAYLPALDQKAG